MASLARLIGGGSQDPLPLFGVWSNYSNTPGWGVYDSDLGQIASGRADTSAEMYSAYTGNNYNDGNNVSSNNFSTGWVSATPFQQADGNWLVNLPASSGWQSHVGNNPSTLQSHWPYFGTVIEQEGVRPRYSLYVNGTTVRVYPRGGTQYLETFNYNSSTFITTGGGTSTSGMISYSERLRKLAIITSDGSSFWYHEWYHPGVSLGKDYGMGSLYKFMSEAKAGVNGASYKRNTLSWSTSSYSSYSESQYHNRIILGDNGMVGLVRMTPSNQTIHSYFTPGANEASVSKTDVSSLSLTTSYGIEQGQYYGMRHNHTWDNNWFACYSPYYYYGSGINIHFVSAKDPSKGYNYQNGGSSNGFSIVPIGESKFLARTNETNADGTVGLSVGYFDPAGIANSGYGFNGSAVSNGGTINYNQNGGIIDTYYTSTLYPTLIPMRSWRQK